MAICLMVTTACVSTHRATLPIRVAVAFAPIGDIARHVGGPWVTVTDLIPAGSDPHEHDPTPKEIDRLQEVDAVMYLRGFQPAVDRAVDALPAHVLRIDLFQGIDHTADDPHVWLSPAAMQIMARTTAAALNRLVAAAAPHRLAADTSIDEHLQRYLDMLASLDRDFRTGLAHCASRTVVSSHRSFSYLAHDYHLEQAGIAGLSPGDEPSAKQLQAIIDLSRRNRVGTIFFDRNMPSGLARTVAAAAGAQVAVLDPVETFTAAQVRHGDTYESTMRRNLASLHTGLECA
jgi:zinc transport system substrate-binding protein